MKTDPRFLKLSDNNKKLVAKQAQNIGNVIVGEEENWAPDSGKYQDRMFLVIQNGQTSY